MAEQPMLQLGPHLILPPDAVTRTLAILAATGAGKSNGGAVLAEEFYAAALPFVVIDPKGDWWGLRSSGDGTGPGLQVPIFGGLHGDLPLLPESGKLIADLIVDQNLTCILDVSEFPSRAAQMRFLADFGEQLYRRHGKDPQARHLILEEADEYLPQVVRADEARCVGVWSRIVKRGRQRGLGITIISQRSASVNKDGLSQCQTLIAMRTTGAHDRKAILDWVSYHEMGREIVDSLPGLDDGEARIISPQWLVRHGQPAVQSFRFRRRWTYDSGATPEVGQERRVATLADIDLGQLEKRMAAVIEQAGQDDPVKLRKRVAELERKLAAKAPAADRGEVDRLTTDIGNLRTAYQATDEHNKLLRTQNRDLRANLDTATSALSALRTGISSLVSVADHVYSTLDKAPAAPSAVPTPAPARLEPQPVAPTRVEVNEVNRPPASLPSEGNGSPASLPKAQRAILTVLAQFPEGRTKRQLAMQSGYSAKGGGFNNSLSSLRSNGLIERGEPIRATAEGLAALGAWEALPEGSALIDHWMGQLAKAEAAALRVLLEAWPASLTKAEIAARTDRGDGQPYSPDGGGFNNALSRLRTLQLIDGYGEIQADETLARQARQTV